MENVPSNARVESKEAFTSTVNTQKTVPKKGDVLYNLTVYEYDLAGNCVEEIMKAQKTEKAQSANINELYLEVSNESKLNHR
jgi:hypothetical protein